MVKRRGKSRKSKRPVSSFAPSDSLPHIIPKVGGDPPQLNLRPWRDLVIPLTQLTTTTDVTVQDIATAIVSQTHCNSDSVFSVMKARFWAAHRPQIPSETTFAGSPVSVTEAFYSQGLLTAADAGIQGQARAAVGFSFPPNLRPCYKVSADSNATRVLFRFNDGLARPSLAYFSVRLI